MLQKIRGGCLVDALMHSRAGASSGRIRAATTIVARSTQILGGATRRRRRWSATVIATTSVSGIFLWTLTMFFYSRRSPKRAQIDSARSAYERQSGFASLVTSGQKESGISATPFHSRDY